MTNEMIGIAGAIALTVILFVLRHLILPSERSNKRRYVRPMARRENHELNKKSVEDEGWLLLAPDIEVDARTNRHQSHEPREERRKRPRYYEPRDDSTIGGEIR